MTHAEQREPRVVAPTGRLDASAAPQLKLDISSLIERDSPRIVVNLAAVPYLSSSILRVLLWAHKQARRAGGALVLCCLQPQVMRVIKIVGFDQVLSICSTEQDAMHALGALPHAPTPGEERG
jgi:stage II sporulation protein AA (anti-sigma F factor antagonist)